MLEKHQLLLNKSDIVVNNTQHGFTENRSTVSALTFLSQNWYNATDNSKEGRSGVHALFLDFRKAFDLVDHGILLRKLAELNVNKSFWMWTKSFLEERSQQVKLGDTKSRTVICRAGVPQGSVISPTLFNVHINDLEDSVPGHLNVSSCKYADDCTQYDIIQEDDNSKIQEALDAVDNWAIVNKMQLNPKKTKDMWICFRNDIEPPSPLILGNSTIERVTSFKLLGVWHQNDLKWNQHIEEITKKANKRLYFLRECRRANLPKEVGITCYLTKIRPLLEYGAAIWGGLPDHLANELENVQKRSLDIICLPRDSLPSLEERRKTITTREFQRILEDSDHPCHTMILKPTEHQYNLRTKNLCQAVRSGTERHKQSFIPRAAAVNNI